MISIDTPIIKRAVELIFFVKQDANSPYQGRLLYDAAVYDGMTADQISADQLAQYNAWLANQFLTPAQLKAQEIAANVDTAEAFGSVGIFTFNYSTIAENIANLRTIYAPATQTAAIMLGDALGGMTNAQLQTAFGMTLPQVVTLRANYLTPSVAQAAAIRAAKGT